MARPVRAPVAKVQSILAGIGGWNARDSVRAMAAEDAPILNNWIPQNGRLDVRGGYRSWATGMSTAVETLAAYSSGTTKKLIAAANGDIWDVSANTAATNLTGAVAAFSSNRWQTLQMGSRLFFMNGVDTMQVYDGATVAAATFTGVTLTNLIQGVQHRSRLYFVEKDTLKVWYGGVDAIAGALTSFDLSTIASYGGELEFCVPWTRDTGTGSQEVIAFVTSNGEVMIYEGGYPGAPEWAITNRFKIGAPLGRRGYCRFGGDTLIMAQNGWTPLSSLIAIGLQAQQINVTDKIQSAQTFAAVHYAGNFGWAATYYPRGQLLVFNVPVNEGAAQEQYVYNTQSSAWTRFLGMHANAWSVLDERLYFGGNDGVVYIADDGLNDNGNNTETDIQVSFNSLGNPQLSKRVTMFRPVFLADANVAYLHQINTEYDISPIVGAISSAIPSGLQWDTFDWDEWLSWGSAQVARAGWVGTEGAGYAIGPRLRTASKEIRLSLIGIDMLYEESTPGFGL